ncbi:AAA family ATPase [Streptomyces sasae]|uniref:AAA family ATPase n=1 Tax=Streptomyces sasae TaxID=1266772 RepID=UPI00292CF7E3|nr:AAA family ATPase [Streptomyces sasae]
MAITRALVVAVGAFSREQSFGEPDPNSPEPYAHLEFAGGLADELAAALGELGHELLGEGALHDPDGASLAQALLAVRSQGAADDGIVIHFVGHGVRDPDLGSLHLVAADTDPDRVGDSAVEVGALVRSVEANNTGPRVLLLLDICHAGQAARIQGGFSIPERSRKCWVVGASSDRGSAYSGRFTKAAVSVLRGLARGALDIHFSYEYVPVETVAREIHRVLVAMDPGGTGHRQTVSLTGLTEIADANQPFFRNPAYDQAPADWFRKRSESGLRGFLDTLDQGLDAPHFLGRAFATPRQSRFSGRCLFTGRHDELRRLSSWLDSPEHQEPLVVVTGSPGVGKSALLGVLVCLGHPALDGVVDALENRIPRKERPAARHPGLAAVHARGLSLEQVIASIHRQLGFPGPAPGPGTDPVDQFVAALTKSTEPPVLIIDALDEAAQPSLLADLVLRLTGARRGDRQDDGDRPVCRLLVGCRPWRVFDGVLTSAKGRGTLVDLDAVDTARVREDVSEYLAEVLEDPEISAYSGLGRRVVDETAALIADRLVDAAEHQGAFLVAGLFAHYLATAEAPVVDPSALLGLVPTTLGGMLELDLRGLGRGRPWLRPVLAALAHAEGAGLPRSLLRAAVLAFAPGTSPREVSDADVDACLTVASFYLRRSVDEDGSTLYRLFHQALADHLLRHPADPSEPLTDPQGAAERVFTRLLHGGADIGGSASDSWRLAPPYLLRHAAAHAARADRLEDLLSDPGFLMQVEPASVLPYLERAGSSEARLYAAVYRTSAEVHRQLGPRDRLRLLALDASRWGALDLAEALWTRTEKDLPELPVFRRALWATGSLLSRSLLGTASGPNGPLIAVATVAGEQAETFTVAADAEGGLWTWTLTSFTLVGHVAPDPGHLVTAVTATALADGTPVAVTACDDLCARLWDLRTMSPLGDPLLAHTAPLTAVASARLGDSRLFATASRDGTAALWDLDSLRRLAVFESGHRGAVTAVTMVPCPDGLALVTVDQAGVARLWSLDRDPPWDMPAEEAVTAVTSAVLADGSAVIVTGHQDGSVWLWDAGVRGRPPSPVRAATDSGPVGSIAVVPHDGQPVLVVVDAGGTPTVRDLAGPPDAPGRELHGHTSAVLQAAPADGSGIFSRAVTAGRDGTVRCWNLASESTAAGDGRTRPIPGHPRSVTAVVPARRDGAAVVVIASGDGSVHLRDRSSGHLLQEPLRAGHHGATNAFALAPLPNGATLALVVGEYAHPGVWHVGVWNVERGKSHGMPLPAPSWHGRRDMPAGPVMVLAALEVPVGGEPLVAGAIASGAICIWNLHTRQRWKRPLGWHYPGVNALLSLPLPDGGPGLLSADEDGEIAYWDVGSRRCLTKLGGGTGAVLALAAWPAAGARTGGDRIGFVSAGEDGLIRMWDLRYEEGLLHEQRPLHVLTGPAGPVLAVATTAEAAADTEVVHLLAAAGSDRTVHLWALDGSEPVWLDSLTLPYPAQTLAFTDPHSLCIGFGNDVAVFTVGTP